MSLSVKKRTASDGLVTNHFSGGTRDRAAKKKKGGPRSPGGGKKTGPCREKTRATNWGTRDVPMN